MELPPDAYISETKKDMFTLREGRFNNEGRSEFIEVNQYRMTKFDFNKKIYQYDVSIHESTLCMPILMTNSGRSVSQP
jgi:eukaryotic translation initiation factor 2C